MLVQNSQLISVYTWNPSFARELSKAPPTTKWLKQLWSENWITPLVNRESTSWLVGSYGNQNFYNGPKLFVPRRGTEWVSLEWAQSIIYSTLRPPWTNIHNKIQILRQTRRHRHEKYASILHTLPECSIPLSLVVQILLRNRNQCHYEPSY